MQKQFNDSIIYVRNGKPLPAIVLASQESPLGELLTLLYADPTKGPTLLAQGTTRGIAQVQQAVTPMVEGNVFGWEEVESVAADMTIALLEAADKENDQLRQKIAEQEAILNQKPEPAPLTSLEQLDEVQGPVEPGDPESPHAIEPIMPTDPTSVESIDAAKAAGLAAEQNAEK